MKSPDISLQEARLKQSANVRGSEKRKMKALWAFSFVLVRNRLSVSRFTLAKVSAFNRNRSASFSDFGFR